MIQRPSLLHSLLAPGRRRMALFLQLCGRWLGQGMTPLQVAFGLTEIYHRRAEEKVAHSLLNALQSGRPFSAGLLPWLSSNDRHRLLAIEKHDDLPAQLEILATDMTQNTNRMTSSLAILSYALLLVVATAAILVLVVHAQVLPALATVQGGHESSPELLLLSVVSGHLADKWWMWPPALIGSGIGIRLVARSWIGNWRCRCDKLPLFRWYRLNAGARLLHTLSFLVCSGDTWLIASERLGNELPGYHRALLQRFQNSLAEGLSPVAALDRAGWLSISSRLQLYALEQQEGLSERAARIAQEQTEQGSNELQIAVRLVQLLLYLLAGTGMFLVLSTGRALSNPSAGF